MSERPKSVEKGQRWQSPGDKLSLTIYEAPWSVDPTLAYVQWDGSKPGGVVSIDELLTRWRYLGGPTPTPGEGKGMEENERGGLPAFCLKCGGEKGNRNWACEACENPWSEVVPLVREWSAGARDFPRPARPAPALSPTEYTGPHLCGLNCYATGCHEGRIAAPRAAPEPLYGRMVGEMRDASGAPLSALERIQAKKPSEPWVPGVDEDHWIPNVGERGWR